MTIYNALQPPVLLSINERKVTDRSRSKNASFEFVQAFITNPAFHSKSHCFVLSDFLGMTPGYLYFKLAIALKIAG